MEQLLLRYTVPYLQPDSPAVMYVCRCESWILRSEAVSSICPTSTVPPRESPSIIDLPRSKCQSRCTPRRHIQSQYSTDPIVCTRARGTTLFIAKSPLRLAPEWSLILVKISHITMDFAISPSSDRIILGLGSQLCITWIKIRPTGFGWYRGTRIMPFQANIYSNLATDRAI